MLRLRALRLVLACGLLSLIHTAALAGDGLSITISNNTTKDLVVTIYDLNANRGARVLSGERINSFASITVTIAQDASGRGHVRWTATSGGHDDRTCGHHDKPGLNDGDTVHVYANSPCQ
jgi:hypothetical protein